jgi:hypothetical protein
MGIERRKHKRTKIKLPLRMWLSAKGCTPALVEFAHTLDVAESGARLGGIRSRLQPGDTITLQRENKRAQFRVSWAKQVNSNELQVGIESLEKKSDFWGLKVPRGHAGSSQDKELLLRVVEINRAS